MEPSPGGSGTGEVPGPSSSSSSAAPTTATVVTTTSSDPQGAALPPPPQQQQQQPPPPPPSRYESQKRRDWNTFLQYLKNHKPPLTLARCSGAHVIEFLKYLDQFGKTKVHASGCSFYGHPNPPSPCACPLRQAWGSLDALIGRLRAAYEENGGKPESNPFGARAVRIYLKEIRESQAKARGIPYEKKRKRSLPSAASSSSVDPGSATTAESSPATLPTASTSAAVGGEGSVPPPPSTTHP